MSPSHGDCSFHQTGLHSAKWAVALRLCWINTWTHAEAGERVWIGCNFWVKPDWRDPLRWMTVMWVRGGRHTCLSGEDISQVRVLARGKKTKKTTLQVAKKRGLPANHQGRGKNCRILWRRSTSAGVASPVDAACVQSAANISDMQTTCAENEPIVTAES